jgi:uncharacterized protein YbjT (DUF2867 family)
LSARRPARSIQTDGDPPTQRLKPQTRKISLPDFFTRPQTRKFSPMQILVTGATGYVGAALMPQLTAAGHDVRAFARDPSRVAPGYPVVRGDAITGAGLEEALEGVEVAYYLIHSMESGGAADGFASRDRQAAERFGAVAAAAGVRRIVYLGGLQGGSAHLTSREEVERVVLDAVPDSVAFRASIIVGAHSRSFRFLVRLVERLPVVPLPAWRDYRTAPIDGRDVLAYLVAAAESPLVGGERLDLGGPQVLTYAAMIDRIRDAMLVGRGTLRLRFNATPLASRVAATIAGEDHALVGPLMEGLTGDLLPRDDRAQELLPIRLHSFDAAVERALRDWEAEEELAAR